MNDYSWKTKRSLQLLESAVSARAQFRSAAPRAVRWEVLHAALGVELPPDFRALAEAYPPLEFEDFLRIELPRVGEESSYVARVREASEILQDLCDMGDAVDYVPYPEPGGLLLWGSSTSGDCFYWRTWSESPADWPIVVMGENGDWSEHVIGVVDFLAAIYRKDVLPPGMPENFPSDYPDVVAL
ncbi:SMI1/KNR4 family protein [Salininema proteolyticum]|uniref:Knr4/Smi1-like domain-containing protein n=1 Tax=Salininema proteolyticum TaxID=1607685 RepID=A0ABV8TX96_9ACTN